MVWQSHGDEEKKEEADRFDDFLMLILLLSLVIGPCDFNRIARRRQHQIFHDADLADDSLVFRLRKWVND